MINTYCLFVRSVVDCASCFVIVHVASLCLCLSTIGVLHGNASKICQHKKKKWTLLFRLVDFFGARTADRRTQTSNNHAFIRREEIKYEHVPVSKELKK
jgi:hypothetical protein